jgi:fructose-specific phosphotransferase system IIA component
MHHGRHIEMKLTDYIGPENIKLDLEGSDKQEVIEALVDHLADQCERCDADTILEAVLKRERDGSTGLEKGIAIPHAKCDAVDKLRIVVGISKKGVDFEAQDGQPSHLFFLMIAPTTESGPHVQAIAKIVKMIKVPGFREKLLKATRPEQIIEAMERVENGEE